MLFYFLFKRTFGLTFFSLKNGDFNDNKYDFNV